jgi:2-polyprenyl-3-methyl-5-hydroxy-6-metoxy-1,4-benzoquinol methylase
VLDVGCGGGLWLVLLRETGRISRGVGFDSSKPAIDLARALPASGGAPLEFLHLPAQDEWPAGPFDAVSIIDVLHHVPTDVASSLFVNAFARLRPGGILIYKDMYPGSWRSLCNRLHDLVMARQIIHLARTEQVERWAAAAGFRPVLRRRTNMLWYGHELHVFERPMN